MGSETEAVERPAEAKRLEQARLRRGFKSAREAAARFGWTYDTYIQHERGERGLARAAEKYAKAYRVSRGWLLTGEGDLRPLVRIVGRVGADPDGRIAFADGDLGWDYAPVPPGGSEDSVALEVAGFSMPGLADDGALVYYDDRRNPPTEDMLGHIVLVGLDSGEVLVKRLLRGSRRGRYDLESIAGPTRTDAHVEWAAHITAIVPPVTARRIIIRGDA